MELLFELFVVVALATIIVLLRRILRQLRAQVPPAAPSDVRAELVP